MTMTTTSHTASAAPVVISTTKYEDLAELLKLVSQKVTPGASPLDVSNSADVEDVCVKMLRQIKAYNNAAREAALRGVRDACVKMIDAARQTRLRAVAAWEASPDMQEAMPGFNTQTHIRLLCKSFAPCMAEGLTPAQVIHNMTQIGLESKMWEVSVPDGRKRGPQDPYIIVPIAPSAK